MKLTMRLGPRSYDIILRRGALGLPVRIRYDGDEIYSHLVHDKKAANGTITLVKVKQPGTYRLEKVPVQALRAMIGEGIG